MNRLSHEKQVMILSMLVEGASMRSIARDMDVSFNTVRDLLVNAGTVCTDHHDQVVTGVSARRIQCDEIWSFCYAKTNDVWTWTGLDEDSKLMVSYVLGDRTYESALVFMKDLRSRLEMDDPSRWRDNPVNIGTDGLPAYPNAIDEAFGAGARHELTDGRTITNSYVERQNLNMRMGMRRYIRKTNAFSKKMENLFHLLSLYYAYYNFVRIHLSLRTTPAKAAALTTRLHDMDWIAGMVNEAWPAPNRPETYRKKVP